MPNVLIGVKNRTLQASWEITKEGIRKTGQATYIVVGETLATTEESIRATTGVPQLGAIYSDMYTQKVTAKQHSPCKHPGNAVDTWCWYVDCAITSDLDLDWALNPLLRPPVYNWGGTLESVPLEFDTITGALVQTAAGEAINLDRPAVQPVVTVTKYHTYPYDANLILNNAGRANSVSYLGAPVGTALLLPPTTQKQIINNVEYAFATYRVKFDLDPNDPLGTQDTWATVRIPHRGTQYLSALGRVSHLDGNGNPNVYNLKSDGTLKDSGIEPDILTIGRVQKTNFAGNIGI